MIPLRIITKCYGDHLDFFINSFHITRANYEHWGHDVRRCFEDGNTSPDNVRDKLQQLLRAYIVDKSYMYSAEEMDIIAKLYVNYIMLDIAKYTRIGTDAESQELYDILDI